VFLGDLVCQPLVTSYVIDAYLCFAMLLEYVLRLRVDTYEGRKPMASWRRPRPRDVWLKVHEGVNALYRYLRCGDLTSEVTRGHGSAQRSLGLCDDNDNDDDDDDDKVRPTCR